MMYRNTTKCLQITLARKPRVYFSRCLSSQVITDDKYLQRSIVPTYHYQDSLPRLPIPKLEDTCRRYLNAQKVISTSEEYEQTKKLVELFKQYEAPELQKELIAIDKQNKHTSYITEPWTDMYLRDRKSVVLNHNPFMTFQQDPNDANNQQLVRATNFIVSGMKFKNSLDNRILDPEVFHLNPKKSDTAWFKNIVRFVPSSLSWYAAYLMKAFPLDMSQYNNLFSSTRLPQMGKDKLVTYEDSRHVLVIHHGNYYVFDVIDEAGVIRPSSEILANLQGIVNDTSVAQHSVGTLTSADRDSWTASRQEVESIAANTEPLKLIDSALFVLCLDDHAPESPEQVTRTFLHGNGSDRWFDKSFQLTVCQNGISGIHFEHAWGDGVAVLRFFNEVFTDTTQNPTCTPAQLTSLDPTTSNFRKLEFSLTSSLEKQIIAQKEKFQNITTSLDMTTLQMAKFGKMYLKEKKLSPDAMMQLAFQITENQNSKNDVFNKTAERLLHVGREGFPEDRQVRDIQRKNCERKLGKETNMAFYRHQGRFVGTYESCSTAAFKHGRTETIRPASLATVACAQAFERNHKAGTEEMQSLIRKASDYHNKLTKEAAMGQGFDRHLFGLRHLAEVTTGKVPKLYQDPCFTRLNHIILSTSTMSSPAVLMGGFAPVVHDGFGIGYAPDDVSMKCNVLSYGSPVDVNGFVDCIESSFEDMHEVLEGRNFKNKST